MRRPKTVAGLITVFLLSLVGVFLAVGSTHRASASLADCAQYNTNFVDTFQTLGASSNGGLQSICQTTSVNSADPAESTWNDTATSCIQNVASPVASDGLGSRVVQAKAASGAGVNGSAPSCTWAQNARYIQEGKDYYYGFMWYFKKPWVTPSGLMYEFQLQPAICGAPLGVAAYSDAVKLDVRTGLIQCAYKQAGPPQYSNGGSKETSSGNLGGLSQWSVIPKGKLQSNTWYEVIVHIHWAADTTGQVQSWYRTKGSTTWNKTIDQTGFPTLEWGCHPLGSSGTCWNATPANEQGWATVDHFGYYRYCDRDPCPADEYYTGLFARKAAFSDVSALMP